MWPNDADGNAIRAALGPLLEQGRLHDRRPGRLHRRHQRLLVADRQVQGRTSARSSTRSRSRRTSRRSGSRPRSRATSRRSRRSPRPACSRRRSRRSARSASTWPARAYWTPTYPYTSSLTNIVVEGRSATATRPRPASSGTSSSARAWPCSTSPPRRSRRPPTPRTRRRWPRRSARSTRRPRSATSQWGKGPNANVVATPIIGGQWVAAGGSKYPLDFVMCENSSDPNVPVAAKLKPYA